MGKSEAIFDIVMQRITALSPVEVVFPNLVDESDPALPWQLEVGWFPNRPKGQGLRTGVVDQGLLVLSAAFPKDVGEQVARAAEDLLKDMFPKGLVLYNEGFRFKVEQAPYSGAPLSTDTKFRVPVTVEWVS